MKILTQQLVEGLPKPVHHEYNAKDLDLEFVDLIYKQGLTMDGTVEKMLNTVTFRGQLTSRIVRVCARCLKEIEDDVKKPFEFVYDVKNRFEVDTLDDLREVLILDRPIRFLCREDCRGLCQQCGTNLNENVCGCQPSYKE